MLKKVLKSRAFLACLGFVLGAAAMYGWQRARIATASSLRGYVNQPQPPSQQLPAQGPFGNAFGDDDDDDPFQQLRAWFGQKYAGALQQGAQISTREDNHFVYYDVAVAGVKPEKLDVKIEDGQVNISGKIEKKVDEQGNESFMSSSFHRSFPVPEGVDAAKVQIEPEGKKLVIKFPKTA